jgi:hypothetical protein
MRPKNTNDRAYINRVPVRHGELTIVASHNAESSMKHSAQLAAKTQQSGVPVLLINCAMSDKQFKEHFNKHHAPSVKRPHVVLMSSVRGNLIGEKEAIDQIIEETGTGVIIISGWEWTAASWRRKQRLLFYLRELMEERDVAIVIYSHVHNAPVAKEIDHGGLGKLSLLAMFVVELEASEHLENESPKPPPLVSLSLEEDQAAERSAQLLINKMNRLQRGEGENDGQLVSLA